MGTILVTGATGNVGTQLVKQLQAQKADFKALVHTPGKAKALQETGIVVVTGDFDKPETLEAALQGISKVFLLSSPDQRQAELQGSVVKAAKKGGVKHIVKLAALGTSPKSPVSLLRKHAETEKEIAASGMAYTFLRPHFFMQNSLMFAGTVAKAGAFYGSMKDAKISLVDVRDVAAVAAAALTQEGHENKAYDITGPEALSFHELAEVLSKVTGKKVTYVDVPLEETKKGMVAMGFPQWLAEGLAELYKWFSEGHAAQVTKVVAEVAKKKPYTFEEFVREYAPAFKG
jgi:uncharacterized protein YbjT (DUF2867 family)